MENKEKNEERPLNEGKNYLLGLDEEEMAALGLAKAQSSN